MFTQSQRRTLQSPGNNILSYLEDKVKVKKQSEKINIENLVSTKTSA